MDGFTLIDAVVAAVIALSAILAYARGAVREIMAIAGWIAAGLLALNFADDVTPLIKEIPVIGPFLDGSCELAVLAGFTAVFALSLVVFSMFTPLLSSAVRYSAIGTLDQGFGFLFGAARGVLIVAIGFFAFGTMSSQGAVPMVDNSKSAAIFANLTGKIEERDPEAALGWITGQYEALVATCAAN